MSSPPRHRPPLRAWETLRRAWTALGIYGPLDTWLLESRVLTYLILLAALALRVWRLADANLWWDEALAIWAVRKGLVGATLWTASDVHPPLYFWFLWAWVQLFGQSEFAMRSLSVFAALISVALVYCVGARLGGRRTGNLAALFTALARFHVWWSQEMRMYMLAGLLGVASSYCLLRWWHNEHDALASSRSSWLWLTAYTACSVGGLYTILLMGALLVAQNVAVLISWLFDGRSRRTRTFLRWLLSQAAIASLLAVWLAFSWGRMRTWSVADAPMSPLLYIKLYGTLLVTGISENIDRYAPVLLLPLSVVLLAGGLAVSRFRSKHPKLGITGIGALLLGLTVVSGGVAIYAATLPRSLFYTPHVEARYFVPFAPAFWILLAWSTTMIACRWRGVGAAFGVALLALWLIALPGYYRGRYLHDTLQTMSRTIVSQAQEGDVVLLDSGSRYPIFLYYYEGLASSLWRPPMVQIPREGGELKPAEAGPTLEPLLGAHPRIWLAQVDVNLADPQQLARQWLDTHSTLVLGQRFGADVLYLYDPQGRPPALGAAYMPQYPLHARIGTNGLLRGWELPVSRYTGGDVVHLALLWERVPDGTIEVALRTPDGRTLSVRRVEAERGATNLRQQFDLPIYSATPSGEYQIVLTVSPEQGLVLGSLTVSGTQAWARSNRPAVSVNAQLGEEITLVGYTLQGARRGTRLEATPGATLTLDLYWRAGRKPQQDYTVFTHLLGQAHNPRSGGPLWAQHDGQPVDGGYPTSQWLEGQIVVDRHRLMVDEGAPEGDYQIEIGMYTVEDGQRLAATTEGGQALGDRILLESAVTVIRR